MKLTLSNGSSNRGAQMGRRNIISEFTQMPFKMNMEKLKWVDGDYDQFGAYWGGGSGDDVYCAHEGEQEIFVRARSRNVAKDLVREYLPNCKFYR